MTPVQAYKAIGDDPCTSCPEYQPRQPCASRPSCKERERYCFRRKIVEAARKKDIKEYLAINRMRYIFKTRKMRKNAKKG